ncbi:helix-turn-helix domain-containing protein [Methylomusa anaerophila]|nr:helix-turn-helix domain-containing protein [Methylomusa anaerophila]
MFVAAGFIGGGDVDVAVGGGKTDIVGADYVANFIESRNRPPTLTKYAIKSICQLQNWISKYNGHEKLKSSGTGGATIMIKGRKTSYEERVEIVKYCIEQQNNYAETAQKYQVSYQQVYSWTTKYETDGVEALQDKRGKRKTLDAMSEIEKLRAENKLLEAKNKRQQMEIEFLKKLEEIERRRS